MSRARAAVFLCACAIVANAVPEPALAPVRRADKESRMMPEKSIVVRRVPNAYLYPFSLWPLPKFPSRIQESEESLESFHYRRNIQKSQNREKR